MSMKRAALLLCAVPLMSGCVGYSTYSPDQGDRIDSSVLNEPAVQAVISKSLEYVITRFPPTLSEQEARLGEIDAMRRGPVAVSLPRGMTREQHDSIIASLGGGVEAVTPGSTAIPTYRVGQIRVRGSHASVDIHRPLLDHSNALDLPYQCITVRMRSGFDGWRVQEYQAWLAGAVPLPALNALRSPPPADPDTEQARVSEH